MGFPRGRSGSATSGTAAGAGGSRRMVGGGGMWGGPTREFTPVPKERRGRTLRRIVAFFRPYRLRVTIVLVAILATSFIGLVNPYLLKLLIDDAIPKRDFGLLNLYVGLMIVLPIVTGLIGVGQAYLNNVIGQNVMQDLRGALYAHLQRMPLRFFTETRTGEIQSRLANDVGGVQSVVTDTASSVTSNLAVAISTIVAMFLIDWRLTLLSLGLLPFFMYLTYRVGKVRREVSTETQKSLAEMSRPDRGDAQRQRDAAVEDVRPAGRRRSRGSGASTRGWPALQIRQAMVGRWFFMIIGTIFTSRRPSCTGSPATSRSSGDPTAPTIGDIVAFTTLQSRLFFPLGQLLNVQVEIQGALALFDRIFEYLEMDPEIVDAPDAVDLEPAEVRGQVRLPRRVVPLPDRGGPVDSRARGGRARPRPRTADEPDRDRGGGRGRRSMLPAVEALVDGRRAGDGLAAPALELLPGLRARGHRLRGRAGRARRARRPVGLRQDDDDLPDPAAVRRRLGRRRDRRPSTSGGSSSRRSARSSAS